MRFYSKIDWWLVAVFLGILVVPLLMSALGANPKGIAVPALITAAVLGGILVCACPVYYEIRDKALNIRSGLMTWVVPCDGVTRVAPTHSPLSSPALSLDRLRIEFTSAPAVSSAILISPKDKEGFLQALAAASPGLRRDGEELLR